MLELDRFHGISRLGLFLADIATGKPLSRVPVYAEIVLGDGQLVLPDTKGINEIRERAPHLEPMVAQEMQAWFGLADYSAQDEYWPAGVLVQIAMALDEKGLLKPDTDVEAARPVTREAIKAYTARSNIVRAPESEAPRYPLGMLSTDHAGFVSFDLTRAGVPLPGTQGMAGGRQVQVMVYPYLVDQLATDIALQQRIAPDAIVGKIAIDPTPFANAQGLNLPALQNPGLIDWRLSPGSFAATPLTLIGADGCQSYTPANFATSQVSIRQIVRIDDEISGHPAARVIEYAVSFVPIGHSLGQLLYSLPLAPGESTRLAVINWRRSDEGQRSEDTVLTESLVHDQTRDRLISETVEAALDEWQRGGSVMGGMAHGSGTASGGNASAKLFNIIGLGAGAGNATGNMMSAGGAYSTSSGTRDLSVDTMQKVTDRIHQTSTAVREMHGTVVVQTDQAESQNIETRAFANHNRGHTLNILYHEVLQHYRVVTEYRRTYDAVLMPRVTRNYEDDAFILSMRHRLEPVLLDQTLTPVGFDAVRAIDVIRKDQNRQLPWQAPFWQGDIRFKQFVIQIRVNDDDTGNLVTIHLFRFTEPVIRLNFLSSAGPTPNFNQDHAFDEENVDAVLWTAELPSPIPWWNLDRFVIRMMASSGDVRIVQADVFGIDEAGNSHRLFAGGNFNIPLENANDGAVLTVIRQTPDQRPESAPPALPERIVDPETYYQSRRLKDHLEAEAEYYGRALDLSEDPNSYAISFETQDFGGGKAIDKVAPTPLEILGSQVAFPLIDQDAARARMAAEAAKGLTPPTVERLISLPTRGIFAEAKLGHCNVAEEIDETRFWRWDEHPNPFMASDIAPVQPVTPQTIQIDLQGTTLPDPIISIQNAPAAPDPTAMAEALKLMATPDIFRDMSGRTEVAGMIKNLIDGAVSMAQTAVKAMEAAPSSALGNGGGGTAGRTGGGGGSTAPSTIGQSTHPDTPVQPTSPQEAQHKIKLSENEKNKGNLTDAEHKDNVKAYVAETKSGASKTTDVAVVVNFKHAISGVLDGEFTVEFLGPSIDGIQFKTLAGVGTGNVKIETGAQYTIQIRGHRTQLPPNLGSLVLVPSIAGSEPFEIDLAKHITARDVPISANIVGTIAAGKKQLNITVVVDEAISNLTIQAKVDGSGTLKTNLEGEAKMSFQGLNLGGFKAGVATEVMVGGEAGVSVPVEYKRLTGTVKAEKNDLDL